MTVTATIDHGTTRDGLIQLRRRWSPSGPATATALLVHGMGEHSGRYEHVGTRLAERGIDTVAIDNRGYGQSGGKRAYVADWEHFHNDIEDQLAEIGSLGLPTVLIGHSLGGLMAVGYCGSSRPQPDALIVSGPALAAELDGRAKTLVALGPAIRRFAPGYEHRDAWDATVYAEDVSVGERFMEDPLRVDFVTISLALESIDAIRRARASVGDIDIPVLCVHGAKDKLVPVRASEILSTVPGARRIVYDHLGHEVFNEPEGLDIVDTCAEWAVDVLGA
ncbi:MAG: alpha/beta fold hydrolase [Acidimicrobiales bacterium]